MNEIITPDGKVFVPVYGWNFADGMNGFVTAGGAVWEEEENGVRLSGNGMLGRKNIYTNTQLVAGELGVMFVSQQIGLIQGDDGFGFRIREAGETAYRDAFSGEYSDFSSDQHWIALGSAEIIGLSFVFYDGNDFPADASVFLENMTLGKLYNQVETITFPKSTYTLKPDQSLQLNPDILPTDSYDKTLTWQTTDPSVATVIEGKVFAVDQGSCEIIVESVNGKIGKCTIKVERVPITSIEFESDRIEIGINEIADLEYTIRPADGYSKDLFWASSSDAVRVRNGVIQGARVGSSTVSVTSYNGVTGSIEVVVSLKPKSAIVPKTIQSQYANSPNLLTIINEMASAFNQEVDIEKFKRYIWNVETANGHGLDIWGRIVGVNRNVQVASAEGNFFGFTDGFSPFDVDPFTGQGAEFGGYKLNDRAFRELIMIKAFANIVYATAPNINRFLKFIFKGRGNAFFLITGHMTARYAFDFVLSDFERKIIYELDLLPRPCGVLIDILEEDSANTFGFDGTGYQPFDQGTFA